MRSVCTASNGRCGGRHRMGELQLTIQLASPPPLGDLKIQLLLQMLEALLPQDSPAHIGQRLVQARSADRLTNNGAQMLLCQILSRRHNSAAGVDGSRETDD